MVAPITSAEGSPSLLPVHDHTESAATTLLPHLALPYSLPLYRRIQFGYRSSHTRILATVPTAATTNGNGEQQQQQQQQQKDQCFVATYIDRSRRPETESWLYTAWDTPSHADKPNTCTCAAHLLSLLSHISNATAKPNNDVVPYPPFTPAEDADIWAAVNAADAAEKAARYHSHTSTSAAKYLEDLHAPAMLKVGAMHAAGVAWARALGLLDRDGVGSGFAYRKYVFHTRPRRDEEREQEKEEVGKGGGPAMGVGKWEGLSWGEVREEDLAVVRSRTAIPKTNRTLRSLPSVAVFAPGEGESERERKPVAWAFLAVDGSLSSLHVEPEYRGRGLAKAMGRKIFQDGLDAFEDDLNGLVHADVALENVESNGVCKSLGGIDRDWYVYWVRIDLDKVREIVTAS